MVETIETFVAKLQQEGVQAGQAAAQKLQADAQAQADKIVADAESQAEKIVADAKTEAAGMIERAKTEMSLAARDTVGKLRESLSACLNAIISESAKTTLEDMDFLGKTLHEIVILYAKADLDRKLHVNINVPCEIRDNLKEWAFKELGHHAVAEVRPSFDLRGHLKQVGFEYEVDGGTVEVTLESVVDLLSEMVTPALREVLRKAAGESDKAKK